MRVGGILGVVDRADVGADGDRLAIAGDRGQRRGRQRCRLCPFVDLDPLLVNRPFVGTGIDQQPPGLGVDDDELAARMRWAATPAATSNGMPSGAITEMQPEISVATQTLPPASTASESNIW